MDAKISLLPFLQNWQFYSILNTVFLRSLHGNYLRNASSLSQPLKGVAPPSNK